MTRDERIRRTRARRLAAKADYALQAVRGSGLWRVLYVAVGRPFRPVVAGDFETVEQWLVQRKRA